MEVHKEFVQFLEGDNAKAYGQGNLRKKFENT